MADISKCSGDRCSSGKVCSIREKCYRYKARANPFRQSWTQGDEKDGKCKLFYKMPESGKYSFEKSSKKTPDQA